jgi:hypothetical protein
VHRNRLNSRPELRTLFRLYFNKDNGLAVLRNDVDFAMPGAITAGKNCVPTTLQFAHGPILAAFSKRLAFDRH